MMKNTKGTVCFFNSHKDWGGGEKWHHDAAVFLASKQYRVLFFSHPRSTLYRKLKQQPLGLYPVKVFNLSFLNIFKVVQLSMLFRKNQVATLVIALPSDVKLAGLAAKLARVNKIIYRRGTALAVKNSLLNKLLFRHVVTDIIANSQDIKHKLLANNPELIPARRIHLLYNGIVPNGADKVPPIFHPANKQTIVLCNAGRLVEQKGQLYILEIARRLKQAGYSFKIYIAGKGKLEQQLQKQAQQFGLDNEIEFLGFVENIPGFLRSLDIFLFPSLHEGSSNVLLEAMAAAVPAVAFQISSIPEMVMHEKTGLLARFDDIDEFYACTQRLMQDSNLRKQLGRNARDLVFRRFHHQRNMEALEALLKHTG